MTLIPTQTAPDLDLALVGGGSTEDLKLGTGDGGRFSLVVFYRGLHCPICRKQLAETDKRIEDLKAAGIGQVVAVSMETLERSTRVVNEWHLGTMPFGRPSLDDVIAGVRYAQEHDYPARGAAWGGIKSISRRVRSGGSSGSSERSAPLLYLQVNGRQTWCEDTAIYRPNSRSSLCGSHPEAETVVIESSRESCRLLVGGVVG